jgi:hypothetical protein
VSWLRKQERAAIETVARHFSATWEQGEDPRDGYVSIGGGRIAVEVATLEQRISKRADLARPACGSIELRSALFDACAMRCTRPCRMAKRWY